MSKFVIREFDLFATQAKSIAENIVPPVLSFEKTYELDEMRFFIRKRSNPMWLVYAIDKMTKETAAFYIGKRNNKTLNAVVKTLLNAKNDIHRPTEELPVPDSESYS